MPTVVAPQGWAGLLHGPAAGHATTAVPLGGPALPPGGAAAAGPTPGCMPLSTVGRTNCGGASAMPSGTPTSLPLSSTAARPLGLAPLPYSAAAAGHACGVAAVCGLDENSRRANIPWVVLQGQAAEQTHPPQGRACSCAPAHLWCCHAWLNRGSRPNVRSTVTCGSQQGLHLSGLSACDMAAATGGGSSSLVHSTSSWRHAHFAAHTRQAIASCAI